MPGLTRDIPAGGQILREDLVERIAGVLFLGLEDDRLAVGREISLPGADEIGRDLSDVGQVTGFLLLPILGRLPAKARETRRCKTMFNSQLFSRDSKSTRRRGNAARQLGRSHHVGRFPSPSRLFLAVLACGLLA